VDVAHLSRNLAAYEADVAARGNAECKPTLVVELGAKAAKLRQDIAAVRRERNEIAASSKGRRPTDEQVAAGKRIKDQLAGLESALGELEAQLNAEMMLLPNWIDPETPRSGENTVGELEENGEGVVVGCSDTALPTFKGFQPKTHHDIAEELGIVDFTGPVKTSGQKFASFRKQGALLELALAQWALSMLHGKGFEAVLTPDLVRASVLESCGFSPRGESSHVYSVENHSSEEHRNANLCLTGTAEVPLAGTRMGHRFANAERNLPERLAGFGHCFRAEAGSTGKVGRGLYRLHQFSKVEMFVFCLPEDSPRELANLRRIQEDICDQLGLCWRTIDMFPHELGHPAARKFDVQVFMPSRESFGEVASISTCTDFQARRLDIRYKKADDSRGYVHTLNGTAVAVPRIILALLETHQQEDGSVRLPECLVPFMGGRTHLTRD